MDRRRFLLTSVAGALAAPTRARAAEGKVWRIGFLTPSSSFNEAGHPSLAFRRRLRELGYVEGQNVALEIRSADGRLERLPGLAEELVRLKVDVIVASGRGTIEAAQKATKSVPIVMVIASDPVASGFAASLARPGGNITGLSTQVTEVYGKRLELLKETVPNLSRVALLWEPGPAPVLLSPLSATAAALGLQLHSVDLRSPREIDGAVAAAARGETGAAIVGGPIAFNHRARLADVAVKRRLPIMGLSAEYAVGGCLMAYGPSYTEHARRAADFVVRIIKGAKPADLPIEQPTKFELVINLKTAKALGLTIPPSLLARADEVI